MEKQSFFKKKNVARAFGIVALIGGFFFLNFGASSVTPAGSSLTPTGNIISNGTFAINLISIVGFLLIICSGILIVYSIVKRE